MGMGGREVTPELTRAIKERLIFPEALPYNVAQSSDEMKCNPDLPGGSLKSKPTWSNAQGCSATSAFFVLGDKSRSEAAVHPLNGETQAARRSQDEHERRVVNNTARLAQANEQLRREIKEHR